MAAKQIAFAIWRRGIATTPCLDGKRNFRKFPCLNKRGSKIHKARAAATGEHVNRGARPVGVQHPTGRFERVPEMVPELIVPDLTDCELKPYVSYRTPDIVQSEFTAKDLFDSTYKLKIVEDFEAGKLDEDGEPKEPSEFEKMTPDEAKRRARQTGSDIFG